MQYILCVFGARKDAYALYDRLERAGVACKLVNTPREVSAACGTALKAPKAAMREVAFYARWARTLTAVYLVTESGQTKRYERL